MLMSKSREVNSLIATTTELSRRVWSKIEEDENREST